MHSAVAGVAAAALLITAQASHARHVLPPIDSDPRHCDRAYVGNTIGQANAVADKILDLRKCSYVGKDLSKKVLSGALLVDSDLSKTKLIETVLTKAVATNCSFAGADLTNAVVDRVDFTDSDLSGAQFHNTVVTGSVFTGAKLDGVSFEDALIGREDVKKLCLNPSLQGEARVDVGCRN